MSRLKIQFEQNLLVKLAEQLQLTNHLAVPRITKVVLNVGLNQFRTDPKKIDRLTNLLARIAGQRPTVRRARQAVSSFKIRAGEPVGLALTLRGQRMYDFLDRLINISLPRVRDFRGIGPSQFDGQGNLSLGFRDLSIFPEIGYEDSDLAAGLEVTIVTSASSDQAAQALLAVFGLPLTRK